MRSMWEFVFVSQFLRVFQGKFGFVSFTVEVRIKTIVYSNENIQLCATRLFSQFSSQFYACEKILERFVFIVVD